MLPRPLVGLAFVLSSFIQSVSAAEISYSRDVQPIFTAKCVACHACYDSPCQLNLSSAEGAQRGANQLPVYDGTRTKAQETTRLYLDAHGADAWRRKDFWSVLEPQDGQAALMARMLELGHSQPLQPNAKIPEGLDISINRANQCPTPASIDAFIRKNPGSGMPFAVAGLSDDEYATLQKWLAAGAPVDQQPLRPTAAEARQVASWERFLNQPGAKQSLVSRWLYEHLFLAHLYFPEQGAPGHFFQLVRSRTPSGQPIDPIPTRRPNDDPGNSFYYRLWPIQGVIVHKTHITYPLTAKKLERVQELFFGTQWNTDKVPGYGVQSRANPFATFAAIPPRARYQFMLDNAEYFTRTFIRGPVCRGQIATDVIRDNFWVVFQDPEQDLFVTDANFRAQSEPLLALPGQIDELKNLLGLWSAYRDKRNEYEDLRQDVYADAPPPTWNTIWHGNDNALLSIFRQFDSASVRKGLLGEVPQTLWLMDYPLFERTYYGLVVNFDVFGNVSHQAQTRLYFDLIRNGAEQNFLRLMPVDARQPLLDDWYQNSGKLKMWMDYQLRRRHAERAGIAGEAAEEGLRRRTAASLRRPQCASRPDQPLPGRQLLSTGHRPRTAGRRAGLQSPGEPAGGRPQGHRALPRGVHAADTYVQRQARGLYRAAQPRAQQCRLHARRVAALPAGPGHPDDLPGRAVQLPELHVRSAGDGCRGLRRRPGGGEERRGLRQGGRTLGRAPQQSAVLELLPRSRGVHPRNRAGRGGRTGHEPLREPLSLATRSTRGGSVIANYSY